ncbi:hypothetical protein [Amycolatopsis sp.]|uniref:hypothetical protein n=1 Tax=Amycolatopsis sp. TaxID=37632 RepID=UPI002D80F813|nr:hypothetical protein [Amycolatopsis sp.]HET6703961.1 hypothetical protein [Amycolatopsis sp.]
MGPRQRRRELAEAAQSAGLGALVRIHRGHGAGAVVAGLGLVVAIGSVPTAIAVLIMRSEAVTTWQWPLLLWSALAGLAFLAGHVGPVSGGRRWVGVAHGGLVTWQRGSVRTAKWAEAGGLPADGVCCAGDLRAAIERRAAVGTWTRRRLTGLTVTVLATAAATWFTAVPIAAHVLLGERPLKVAQLARMCEGGRSFGRTAAYEGAAPHPAVVFTTAGFGGYEPVSDDEVATVQLVGCAVLIGEGPAIKSCDYEGGYHRETYQGRYLVEVYEAQTARHVGSFRIDGPGPDQLEAKCAPSILVPESGDVQSDRAHTDPDEGTYRTHLAPFVDGPPR